MKEMIMEDFISRICEILEKNYFKREENSDYFTQEIYVDYRDKGLSEEKVAELLEHDNPKEAFEELLNEWAKQATIEYEYPEMTKMLRQNMTEEENDFWEEHEDEVEQWLEEHVSWYYDENDFRSEVRVNIMLDTGDGNYDFTKNNILNYYGTSGGYGEQGEINELSSILWLSKQQGKEKEVREYVKAAYNNEDTSEADNFTKSVIQELENICSHMSTLTFLVRMDLFELFELQKTIRIEHEIIDKEGYHYEPQLSETRGTVVISKDTMCGLFDPWFGGGSVLEIELDKDVELPIKFLWKAEVEKRGSSIGYNIDEVYGLVDSAWDGKVKEIRPMKTDETK